MRSIACLLAVLAAVSPARAIPPMVSGDVPTAENGTYELFVGYLATDAGPVTSHELPFWELVYGLNSRQELTLEAPLVVLDGPGGSTGGFGDTIMGTKYRLLGEPRGDTGLSVSLEVKLPTGSEDRGLGSGAVDVDLRVRAGRAFSREVAYVNVGHKWVGEAGGAAKRNTWFLAAVWDHPVSERVRVLTEVYARTADEPETPNRLAGTVGIKWKLPSRQQLHFSIGRSVRSGVEGGPDLRLYAGWRRDF